MLSFEELPEYFLDIQQVHGLEKNLKAQTSQAGEAGSGLWSSCMQCQQSLPTPEKSLPPWGGAGRVWGLPHLPSGPVLPPLAALSGVLELALLSLPSGTALGP